MIQKWYQKVSLQAAIVTGIFLIVSAIIAGIFGLYQSIFTLRSGERTSQMRTISQNNRTTSSIDIYDVYLIIPSELNGAEILVDGRPASIVSQTPTIIKVRVKRKDLPHRFVLRKGEKTCTKEVLVRDNEIRLQPCQ